MEYIESYGSLFEMARQENYNQYNSKYYQGFALTDKKTDFTNILNNYLQKIVLTGSNAGINFQGNLKRLGKNIIECITGDYEIGVGDIDFEELTNHAETIASIVAYSNKSELTDLMQTPDKLAEGLVSGTIASGLIQSEKQNLAKQRFEGLGSNIKTFFNNSLHNILTINEKIANGLAHIAGLDNEESKNLNANIVGKFIGGLGYEFLSGTLANKRHFTDVRNSKSMQKKIEEEGILHFSSPETINKIMESKKVKQSSFLISDLTRKKSFFFAGTPSFEDLLINIPAYDVMTAIRIHPTEEQINNLKYRAINDRAVVHDGDFEFNPEQAEIAYFGLMYDREKGGIYLGEISEEEAKDFKVSEEVKNAYHYGTKKNSFIDNIKINAYGFYAEYKHHQKLLQMRETLREHGITSFRDVNDATLVELGDFEQAYISTKDKSVERRNLFASIKDKIAKIKNPKKESKEEQREDELY